MGKKLYIYALAITAIASSARENLLNDPHLEQAPRYGEEASVAGSWVTTLNRPATGRMDRVITGEYSDSVMQTDMRYMNTASHPCAAFSQTLTTLSNKKYRFSAWVKFLRADNYLTLKVSTGGNTLASVTATSSAEADCRMTPGRWTPVMVDVDLSDATPSDLAAVTFSILPQVNGNDIVVGKSFARIQIVDPSVHAITTTSSDEIPDGGFEVWRSDASGMRSLELWTSPADVTRVAGAYTYDHAACMPAGGSITTSPVTISSKKNVFSVMCRSDEDLNIDLTSASGHSRTATLYAGKWSRIEMPVDYSILPQSERYTITGPGCFRMDNAELKPVYDYENPRPVERTLYVTSSGDSGDNTLRDITAQAMTGDEIEILVDEITLASPVDLSDKIVSIKGNGAKISAMQPGESPYRLFEIKPTVEGSSIFIRDLVLQGGNSGSEGGAAIYMGDSRCSFKATLAIENVDFIDCNAKTYGGAIYTCAPAASTYIVNCRFSGCVSTTYGGAVAASNPTWIINSDFSGCSAAHGAAIASTGGSLTMENCRITDCTASGNNGGAVINNNTSGGTVRISRSLIARNSSTAPSGGCSGVAVITNAANTVVENCTFISNTGGRASGLSVYNSSRQSGGETIVVNSTFANGKEAPAVAVGGSSSYSAPIVYLVNNLLGYNTAGDIAIARGTVTGTHNMAGSVSGADIPGTIVNDDSGKDIFASYGDDGPKPGSDGVLAINATGPAKNAGVGSYVIADVNIVPSIDQLGYERGETPSVGATEKTSTAGTDIPAMIMSGISVYPNPASSVIHVSGDFTQLSMVNMSGMTVLTANSPDIDVSSLPDGMYIVVVSTTAGTTSHKAMIKH